MISARSRPGIEVDQCLLRVRRQARRDAVRVHLFGVQAVGLQDHLVALSVGEPLHLVLDRGAVPDTGRIDDPGVER
jgi:hypothetical protein